VWLCHAPLLRAPFLADDEPLALNAARRVREGKTFEYLGPAYWREKHHATKGLYRPVREIVLGLVTRQWGLRPAPFHALNLVLHSINVLLLYSIARHVLGGRRTALWGALLFAVHPAHVEAVGFVKNFIELLAVLFALAAMRAFLASRDPELSPAKRRAGYAAALACFALGLLCKETASALPALLVVALWSMKPDKRGWKRVASATGPFWVLLAAYVVFVGFFLLRGRAEPATAVRGSDSQTLNALATLAFYARFVWLPTPLTVTHRLLIAPSLGSFDALRQVVITMGVLGALGGLALRWRRGRLFLLWAPITIAPVANVVATSARLVGEQRLYLPSAGVCVLMGVALSRLLSMRGNLPRPRLASAVVALLAVCFGGMSLARSLEFSDKLAFERKEARHAPDDPIALQKLGKAYSDRGLLHQAVAHLARGAQAPTADFRLRAHLCGELGTAYGRLGHAERAVLWLRRSVAAWPDYVGGREGLGTALLSVGRPREALPHLQRARELAPDRPGPLVNLGQAHIELADLAAAEKLLSRAAERFPQDALAHVALGVLRSRRGDWPGAVRYLERAARLDPGRRATWARLAAAYRAVGREADARAAMERASGGPRP